MERPFDFPFRLRTINLASPRSIAIVSGEGQKPRVVDRLSIFPTSDDDFHVVVEAGRGHSTEMFKGGDMLAGGGLEVLSIGEVNVLTSRVAQDVAEELNSAFAFLGKIDVISRPIHLSLDAGSRLESNRERLGRSGTQLFDSDSQDRIAALVAEPLQLFVDTFGGDARVALEQLPQLLFEPIELAASKHGGWPETWWWGLAR